MTAIFKTRWTPDMDRRLIELWSDPSLSYTMIGEQLGFTRSAIAGRVRRLRALGVPLAVRDASNSHDTRPRITRPISSRPNPPYIPEVLPAMLMIATIDLQPKHCRFPIGDVDKPGFAHCGRDRHGPLPYCRSHSLIAFRAAPEKQASGSR